MYIFQIQTRKVSFVFAMDLQKHLKIFHLQLNRLVLNPDGVLHATGPVPLLTLTWWFFPFLKPLWCQTISLQPHVCGQKPSEANDWIIWSYVGEKPIKCEAFRVATKLSMFSLEIANVNVKYELARMFLFSTDSFFLLPSLLHQRVP